MSFHSSALLRNDLTQSLKSVERRARGIKSGRSGLPPSTAMKKAKSGPFPITFVSFPCHYDTGSGGERREQFVVSI
jgi:hypothetical protein